MTLNGTLEDFTPAGILKVLSADARTGAVRFGGPFGCTVYLHRGQLYFARNERTDEALATALVRPGRLSADDWGQAIEQAGDRPMVGELLARDGAITHDLLASVVLSVVYDPLIDLFRDGTGEFDFEPETVHWLGPFRAFPVDAIVDEVRKRVREVDEWSAEIPGLDVWVEASRTLPGSASQVTIFREDWELVTALAGPRMISDLAGELGRGAYSTARVVHRLQVAGLVEVVSTDGQADVVPLRRPGLDSDPTVGLETEVDLLLALGLPHRARTPLDEHLEANRTDPLTEHIGEAVAEALAHSEDDTDAELGTITNLLARTDDSEQPAENEDSSSYRSAEATFFDEDPDGIFVADDVSATDGSVDHAEPSPPLDEHRWDESRLVANGGALHHENLTATPLDDPRPVDPNAAWLADLYSQFIDEPEVAGNGAGKKKRRGEPNPVDVAFKTTEQAGDEKISTLKRLMGALKKL